MKKENGMKTEEKTKKIKLKLTSITKHRINSRELSSRKNTSTASLGNKEGSNKRRILKTKQKEDKFNFTKDKKAQAKIFSLLLRASPKPSSWLPTIFQTLLILFQTSFIFSKYLADLYSNNLPPNVQYRPSILKPTSIFNEISDFFNILNYTRKFSVQFIYFYLSSSIGGLLLIYIVIVKFELFARMLKIDWRSLSIANYWIKLISLLLTNFDFFFFFGNTLTVNSIFCREIEIELKTGFESGENFLDSSFESEYLSQIESFKDTVYIKKKVSFLSDDVDCRSFQHYSIATLCVILFGVNCLVKIFTSKLTTFVPNFEIFCTKHSNLDIFIDLLLMLILVIRTLFIAFLAENYDLYRWLFFAYLGILLVCYAILLKKFIFYDRHFTGMKHLQILYLISLTTFSILVRETQLDSMVDESSTIIFFILIVTLLMRIDKNLRSILCESQDDNLVEQLKMVDESSSSGGARMSVLTIYYKICIYIKFWIKRGENSIKAVPVEIRRIRFLIGFLLKKHKDNCRVKHNCFCSKSKGFLKGNNLSFLAYNEECRKQLPLVFESLFLMNEIFKSSLWNRSKMNEKVFFCYVYFLIDYFGSPITAYKLLARKLHEIKIKTKSNSITDVKIYALFEYLNSMAKRNLRRGVLGLAVYPDYSILMMSKMRVEGKEKFLNLGDNLLYIERFEELKTKVLKAYNLKLKFLQEISKRKQFRIKKITKVSKRFYEKKIEIDLLYKKMEKMTRMKFAPLYLIYGNYLVDVSEEITKGGKILKKYSKIPKFKNLNFIFKTGSIDKFKEMVVLFIESDEVENRQVFKYCTTNLTKVLGKNIAPSAPNIPKEASK